MNQVSYWNRYTEFNPSTFIRCSQFLKSGWNQASYWNRYTEFNPSTFIRCSVQLVFFLRKGQIFWFLVPMQQVVLQRKSFWSQYTLFLIHWLFIDLFHALVKVNYFQKMYFCKSDQRNKKNLLPISSFFRNSLKS